MKRRIVVPVVLSILAFVALAAPLTAQDTAFVRSQYTKREVLIPMRDGVLLFTAIYIPRDTTQRHPFVMTRTPYSVGPYGADRFPTFAGAQARAYVRERYILVFQDVRGRYMSEGQFVDVRPVLDEHRTNQDIDETTDTWDTVEWLINNVPLNNGRVGIRGTSYPGFYSTMGAINAHPAVKVVSPQAPVTEWMGGDDFFHNGALLLPHAFDFFIGFGRPRPQPTNQSGPRFDHHTPDGYDFFLRLGPLANANPRYMHDSIAFWNEISHHPTWDAYWRARSARPHLRHLTPAMLWVGGWFDTENQWGALHAYAAAEQQNPGAVNRLVMGPWSHGQWNAVGGDSLGRIRWGGATADFFTDSIEVPFFNYYLKGEGQPAPRAFEAAVFETGANAWRFLDEWPPKSAIATSLYLQAGGRLTFAPPVQPGRAFDEYVSDPARPVPYTAEIRHWYNPAFMLEDQRFASRRPDVLVYTTDELTADVTAAGPIAVDFAVSTSGTDSDWIVKLIDVFPDTLPELGGYQMLVRGDVLRGKFRGSMSAPEPFVPNAVTPIRFTLNDALHTFRAGHRIMVQVQSTWFPMIDRNPGRFMDIWSASDADFRRTTQRVYRSATHPSHLVLPLLQR
jgi:hypothetical protein